MENKIEETEDGKRISKTARWARAHKGFIYEVTDPELRSQLCYYRNKDRQNQQQPEEQPQN